MLVHLDTSVLVDAFTGTRRLLPRVREATAKGHVIAFSAIVFYEWRRGPRTDAEIESVDQFLDRSHMPAFGRREALCAAALYRQVKGARQRQAELAIAASAIESGAALWTLNRSDFTDIPGLNLFGG